jgi:hypothetical protein
VGWKVEARRSGSNERTGNRKVEGRGGGADAGQWRDERKWRRRTPTQKALIAGRQIIFLSAHGLAREWEYTAADHSLSLVNSSIRNNTGSNAHNRL